MDHVIKVEQPVPPRHSIHIDAEKMTISIPSKKRWNLMPFNIALVFVYVGIGLFGAFFLIAFLITNLRKDFASGGWIPILVISLIWISVYCWAIYMGGEALVWRIAGVEVITIGRSYLTVNRIVWKWKRTKNYDMKIVKNFVVSSDNRGFFKFPPTSPFLYNVERISFDYGAKAQHFGKELDDAEARQIIAGITDFIAGMTSG
jgi:hypothetical protein